MYKVFDFPRMVNGELGRDMVILRYPQNVDLDRVFHKLGLEYCMNSKTRKHIHDGLPFPEFIKYITPEMLAPYGIEMLRPNEMAIPMDNAAPIINRHELESNQESCNYGDYMAEKVCNTADRIVRRLETQRTHGHPAISTWGPGKISSRALAWAKQFVYGNEADLAKFFGKKLQEVKPHSNNEDQSPADTDTANNFSEGQRAEHISQ